jgi:hypothetical protein
MTSETRSEATVLVSIGERSNVGWNVSAVYEALEVRAGGRLGGGIVNAAEIIGKAYTGTLSPSGQIHVTSSPEASGRFTQNLDPGALLTELLTPVPPEGANPTGPWPVASTVVSDASVRLTSIFEGTARITGDTVWNGINATLIVAEGTLEIEGRGAPSGMELDMDLALAGQATRLYVWDTVDGVMLASVVSGEADGSLSVAGMYLRIPASFHTRQEVTLRR